jgi:actin-like ATPase involved in cell morphogenesis/Tfp pilus assembly protein PilZ
MCPSPPTDPPAQRQHQRHAVDWRVNVKCKDWRMAGRLAAANASRGGLFLYTTKIPPIGTEVELSVQLPDGQRLALKGKVQHVVTAEQAAAQGGGAGIGVKFDARHEHDLLLLEQMAQAAEQAAASPPPPASEPEPENIVLPRAPTPAPAGDAGKPFARIATVSGVPAAAPAVPRGPARRGLPRGAVCPALGIDFGTSYTSVAVTIGDLVYLVPDAEGRVLQPSIVSFPPKGAPVVGWAARDRLTHDARRTVASVKRLLGHSFSDPEIAGHLQSVPYHTLAGPQDTVLIEVDQERYAVPQVCAAIIAHARDQAEQALDQRFTQVALSCPVTFAEEQKLALRRAAQLAGLEVVALVPEPVAGAMAYGVGAEKNEIVAVYDFGGGTFDFSLLDMAGDHIRLVASEGDAWLGGDDFDLQLSQAVADAFWRATKIELRQRIVEWQRLLHACEAAKRELTTADQATIVVDGLVEAPRRVDLRQRIDRTLFQRLTQNLFDRSLEVCRAALERAGLEPSDVTQLVVTGGVSRIPYVQAGLAGFFEREITQVVNPEEAIAHGAGLRAAQALEHPVRGVAKRG